MAAIVYLDVDDEITSAAARIRTLADERIALVLPLGSRLATSRINFRLLAREAEARGRRIEIVTNDASARALAASAGLPTHLSVAAFEAGPETRGSRDAAGNGPAVGGSRPPGDDSPTMPIPAISRPADRAAPVPVVGRPATRRRWSVVAAVLLGVAIVAASGTAAFLLLPSADVVLIPATESIGPLELNVTAQAGVTQPDPVNLLVPAMPFTFDVAASETFPATGIKVTETAATGEVTFSNLDTGRSNTIRQGAIVKTEQGIEFRTTAEISLPRAEIGIAGDPPAFVVIPSTRKVGIEAVTPGPAGNVSAKTIVVVPDEEDPRRTSVMNEAPTSGGTRTESPQVQQSDVDAALLALDRALATAFEEQVAAATGVPAGTTLFPETRSLGASTPSVDPATLVGLEAATFELGLTARGTAVGVDPGPVRTLADARLRNAVRDGFRLLEDTILINVGTPIVAGSVITFPVTVGATEIREFDLAALRSEIRGLGLPQARTVLEEFGAVRITVWPDWVTTIPTTDRLTLTVEGSASSAPSPAASPADESPGAPPS